MRRRPRVLLSAHRFGSGAQVEQENSLVALRASLELGVDYVEFDLQRCLDGTLVVSHSAEVRLAGQRLRIDQLTIGQLEAIGEVVRYDDVLRTIAGKAKAHIDLKFVSPDELYTEHGRTHEVTAVRRAVQVLGEGELIVTTLDDQAVRAVRDWADDERIDLLVGLSLGRSLRGLPWHQQVRVRVSELRPQLRFTESRANLVVAKHTLARLGVAAFARRRGLPLLVWTIDTEKSMHYWLKPGRAWMVTSNFPEPALAARTRWDRRRRRGGG